MTIDGSGNVIVPPLTANLPVSFSATATDAQDGTRTSGLVWSIANTAGGTLAGVTCSGTGGTYACTFSNNAVRKYSLTASSTDTGSGGATATGTATREVKVQYTYADNFTTGYSFAADISNTAMTGSTGTQSWTTSSWSDGGDGSKGGLGLISNGYPTAGINYNKGTDAANAAYVGASNGAMKVDKQKTADAGMSRAVNLLGVSSAVITYKRAANLTNSKNTSLVQCAPDGATFSQSIGTSWTLTQQTYATIGPVTIPSACYTSTAKIRFNNYSTDNSAGMVVIDNVEVKVTP